MSSGGAGGGMTELPPFMDAVVFAGGDLELGSLSIYTSDHTVNANVRTNSTNPKIGSGSIKGFVFYNSPSGQPKSFPTVSLYPYNPYHEPTVQHRDPVEIPPFDAESLQNLEGINIWTNPKKIGSTNIDLGGAPGNPAFWYFPDGLEIHVSYPVADDKEEKKDRMHPLIFYRLRSLYAADWPAIHQQLLCRYHIP